MSVLRVIDSCEPPSPPLRSTSCSWLDEEEVTSRKQASGKGGDHGDQVWTAMASDSYLQKVPRMY